MTSNAQLKTLGKHAWELHTLLHTYNKVVSSTVDISALNGNQLKTVEFYSNFTKLCLACPQEAKNMELFLGKLFPFILYSDRRGGREVLETFGSMMGYLSDITRAADKLDYYKTPRVAARVINGISSLSLFYQSSMKLSELAKLYREGRIGIDLVHSAEFIKRIAGIGMALIFAKRAFLDKSTPAKVLTTIVAIEALMSFMLYHKTKLLGAPPEQKRAQTS